MDGIGVQVYDPTNTTLIGQVFPSTINVSAPLGGKGTLTMTVPPTDPLLVANPTAMDDCVFRASVPDGAGGLVVEAYANRMPCKAVLVALDGGELVWQVTAAGLDVVWGRDAVILPEYAAAGDMPPTAGRERAVSWAASMYNPASDTGFWDDIIEVPSRTTRPTEPVWPTGTTAQWITCNDVAEGDRKLFRGWLTIAADDTPVGIWYSGDEALTLWLGGEAIASTDYTEIGKKYTGRVNMVLAAGTYAVGIDTITRYTIGGDGYDPVILAVATIDSAGDPVTWLLQSSSSSFVAARLVEDTGQPPGPTVGHILTTLHGEAQGIDIATWDALTLGFTSSVDTDGVAWEARPEMVLTYAGDDYATIWDRLSDTGLDVRITPTGVLEARQSQGTDLSATVTISRVAGITPMVEPALGNTVHTLTLEGWVTVKHAGQYAAQGRRPMFLQLGTAASTTMGALVATNSLPDLAFPQVRHNVTFWATPGAMPLVDYGPGDVVAVEHLTGSWRVLALTASWDGSTEVAWVAEVAAP